MSAAKKHIAVLFHKGDRHRGVSHYIVHHLANMWRADGHDVTYFFGVKRYEPADLILVHVNLTVVPDEYLEFASRFPIALNGRVRDIRKSSVSQNLVHRGDNWDGPVIVKSDLNYAGQPERVLRRTWPERRWRLPRRVRRLVDRMKGDAMPFDESTDYLLFDSIDDVPGEWFENKYTVVEKFRPEVENGLYHNRIYQFLGDRWTCTRISSEYPVVKAATSTGGVDVEPHAEVVAWREKFGLDYGKIDYVINAGEAVLLDVNKTTGASDFLGRKRRDEMRRHRAEGLYYYFKSQAAGPRTRTR